MKETMEYDSLTELAYFFKEQLNKKNISFYMVIMVLERQDFHMSLNH